MAKAKAKETAAPAENTNEAAPPAEGETTAVKSIVSSKYRDAYKGKEPDWLGKLINAECTKTEPRTRKVKDAEGDGSSTVTEQVAVGVDTDKLLAMARKNGLDVDALEAQSGNHGFAGRARMTVRNMLQTVAKQRHGIFNVGGTFMSAPADWLVAKDAPEKPSHNQDGSKIEKPKAPKAVAPAPEKVEA